MDYRTASIGLGIFSLALGAAEWLGARRIAGALDAPDHDKTVRAFGAREVASGVAILQSPAHAPRVWGRVAGDALDMAALALAARRSPGNRVIWGAVAFVAAAGALDVLVALGLDRTTGKTLPLQA